MHVETMMHLDMCVNKFSYTLVQTCRRACSRTCGTAQAQGEHTSSQPPKPKRPATEAASHRSSQPPKQPATGRTGRSTRAHEHEHKMARARAQDGTSTSTRPTRARARAQDGTWAVVAQARARRACRLAQFRDQRPPQRRTGSAVFLCRAKLLPKPALGQVPG